MYVSTVNLFVHDVDRAARFFVESLGWEKRMDVPMGGDTRWFTVGPPGEKTELVLVKGFAGWSPGKVGGFTGIVLRVDDVEAAAAGMMERGVEFSQPPVAQSWGLWAQFVDSEGNEIGLSSVPSTLAATY
jgi:predicted enzyme related to lactoylglutathione lyase